MDGYEATQRIRSSVKGQAIAIIALTASTLENEQHMILSAGYDDFVRKPFRQQTIFNKLQEHLRVQYLYDDHTAESSAFPFNHQHKSVARNLSQQSQPWLSQLHSASSLADAEWVLQLIDELPSAETELAMALRNLVQGFRCDLIAELAIAALKTGYWFRLMGIDYPH